MSKPNFTVNSELTALAIMYSNPAEVLIADQVSPRIHTASKFDWTEYDVDSSFILPDTKVGRKGKANEVDFGGKPQSGKTEDHALTDVVPEADEAEWQAMPKAPGALSPKEIATQGLVGLIRLRREVDVARTTLDVNNYASNKRRIAATATEQWSDANFDAAYDLLLAMEKPFMRPNVFAMGANEWFHLRRNPKLIKQVRGSTQADGVITRKELAEFLEMRPENILVGRSRLATNKKGEALQLNHAWSGGAALLYADKQAAENRHPGFGFTAQFGSFVASEWFDGSYGLRGATVLKVGESVKPIVCAKDCGFLFGNVAPAA